MWGRLAIFGRSFCEIGRGFMKKIPGVGRDVMGREVPALDIERIVRSCGVRKVSVVQPDDLDPGLEETFRAALGTDELTLVIVRLKSPGSTA